MTKPSEFVTWVMEDLNELSAVVGTDRDKQLAYFQKQGFLGEPTCYGGDNVYPILSKGVLAGYSA